MSLSFSLFLFHRRKVADVRREKELAERRKNEPQLGSSQDHLVRKIFSKFRRAQQNAQGTKEQTGSTQSDVEKGDTDTDKGKVNITNSKSKFSDTKSIEPLLIVSERATCLVVVYSISCYLEPLYPPLLVQISVGLKWKENAKMCIKIMVLVVYNHSI